MNWLDDLKTLKLPPLSKGKHQSPEDGLCAMEMVAYLERLPHSDAPECTCLLLSEYVVKINDVCSDSDREKLKPYLPRLVGTVSPAHEQARAEIFAWAAIHRFAPMALEQVGLRDDAELLRSCPKFEDVFNAISAIIETYSSGPSGTAQVAGVYEALRAAWSAAEYARISAFEATTYAAVCAMEAAAAGVANVLDVALEVLDEAINVGPSGGWTNYSTERARELERAN